MPRRACAASILAALLLLSVPVPSATAAIPDRPVGAGQATLELAAQTPVVPTGGTFAMRLLLDGIPADGTITLILHGRVRTRSELALSMEGEGLRLRVFETATSVSQLPAQTDGTRRLTLSLDGTAGGVSLPIEGVYPVELIAKSADGTELATLITHLIVPPEDGDDSPPLGVAVVAEVGAPPALQPDGTTSLERSDVEDLAEVVAGLAAVPDVPLTVAAVPETIDALAASSEPGDIELVEGLRAAAAGRTVIAAPYVEVSPDDLAPAGLLSELGTQLTRGSDVLTDALGGRPTGQARPAPPELGATGLGVLAFSGIRRLVVSDDQVAPLDSGLINYSLAQPFLLSVPADTPEDIADPGNVQALATDDIVLERLDTVGQPGLVASRVLSELAFLRLEQPSVARSVVVPVGPGTAAEVIALLLEGLGTGRPFEPMSLDEAFDHAIPLLDGGGNQVDRRLLPSTTTSTSRADGRALTTARADLDTFVSLVGTDSPQSEPLGRHLLLATAAELSAAERRDHVEAVESAITAVTSTVSTPARFTLTLTAREGTIPLTIRNDSGVPLHVSVRLRSQKLEFPDGDTIDLVLTQESQRIDFAVRARASGAFPLEIDVMTPDGQRSLATTLYTVRSTAVSGAGLVLSLGAGLFLVVWWARHWRRTRRSAKLVGASDHPAAAGN